MKAKAVSTTGCVLVCAGKGCKKEGASKLRKALIKTVEEAKGRVTVVKAPCMGMCSEGPVVVVWPKGIVFTGATPDNIPEILASAGLELKADSIKPVKAVKEKKAEKGKKEKKTKDAPTEKKAKKEKACKDKKPCKAKKDSDKKKVEKPTKV